MTNTKKNIDFLKSLDLVLLPYYTQLINSRFVNKADIENINAIYVFFENNTPQYVGRTCKKRLKQRIQEHSRKCSKKNSATFAYQIAQKDTRIFDFDTKFKMAKERISNMDIKYLEIDEPSIQTILEPYLSYKFNTLNKYNKFDTH